MSAQILEQPEGFGISWIHPCALHGEDEGWYETEENIPCCPECGCLLETEDCIWGCGATWLSYGSNSFDDTVRSATVNESGDLMCARCAANEESELDQEYSDEWQDDYP